MNEILDEVIIVGAGAAGIGALTKLLENGIENVKILEAENRIGGRIYSVHLGDAFVDLGAEEVHGEDGNIVVELAGKYLKKKKALTRCACYLSNGKEINGDIKDRVMNLIERFCENDGGDGTSIGDAFTKRFQDSILKCLDDREGKQLANSFLPLCESFFSILEGPYSWFDVILESASNYEDCEGDQFLGWDSNGCKTILDVLMGRDPYSDKLKKGKIDCGDKILLEKIVKKIHWWDKTGVILKCQDGSIYKSKYVIFTPSVGVLRDEHFELFEPKLTEEKIKVLDRIGYSNVMKVAMRFKEKWWDKAPIGLIWSDDERENSWLTAIHWLMEAPDNPKVLVAWLTGPKTPSVEELSNEEIENGVMKAIKKFLANHYAISDPLEVIPTRWYSNPNFRGTYSYETPETFTLNTPFQTVLEEPLTNEEGIPTLLFAGEATHLTQYSTVNGAILSGYREADRITELYKKNHEI